MFWGAKESKREAKFDMILDIYETSRKSVGRDERAPLEIEMITGLITCVKLLYLVTMTFFLGVKKTWPVIKSNML